MVGPVSKFDFLACFVLTLAHVIPRYEELTKRTVGDIITQTSSMSGLRPS